MCDENSIDLRLKKLEEKEKSVIELFNINAEISIMCLKLIKELKVEDAKNKEKIFSLRTDLENLKLESEVVIKRLDDCKVDDDGEK